MDDEYHGRIFISDLEEILERDARTIRCWVRDARKIFEAAHSLPVGFGYLPQELWPEREDGGRGRIFWHQGQIDGLKAFAAEKDRRRGWQGATAPTP